MKKNILRKCIETPIRQFVLGIFIVTIITIFFLVFGGAQVYVEKTVRDGLQTVILGIEAGKK